MFIRANTFSGRAFHVTMNVVIRGMLVCDLADLARSERESFGGDGWSAERLRPWTRFDPPFPRIGVVAECREPGYDEYAAIAHALYTVRRGRLVLNRLVVKPEYRRRGVGRRLVAEIQKRTLTHFVRRVVASVCETDLDQQCFLRACGATAIKLIPGRDAETEPGLIRFVVPGGFRAPAKLVGPVDKAPSRGTL